jgi:hypothetical protein
MHTVPLSLLLVFAVRIYMVMDIPNNSTIPKYEFHDNQNEASYFTKQSKGNPVVFINSYQQASKQRFYSELPSFSLNTPLYRRNNYNYWPIEDSLFWRPVLVTGKFDRAVLKYRVNLPGFDSAGMRFIDTFYSFSKVRLKKIEQKSRSSSIAVRCSITSPSDYLKWFQTSPGDTASIQLAVYKNDSTFYFPSTFRVSNIQTTISHADLMFHTFLGSGVYKARLGISSSIPGHPTVNSLAFELDIE